MKKIDPAYKRLASIDGVLIIFIAFSPIKKMNVVVGWYDNATVFRNRVVTPDGRMYMATCSAGDAHLIPEQNRSFEVPRAQGNPFGIGQSNFWYIHNNKNAAEFENELREYIASIRKLQNVIIPASNGEMKNVDLEAVPTEYDRPDIHRFSASNPIPFKLSVDVINYGLGLQYTAKKYAGWQKGAFDLLVNGQKYMVWFPKIAINGRAASPSGWINYFEDNGKTLIERSSDEQPANEYELTDVIRLVFAKTGAGPYLFSGVFRLNVERSTTRHHVFEKIADDADFSGKAPIILYKKAEAFADEALIEDITSDAIPVIPDQFAFCGKAKEKPVPIIVGGHTTYPRDRQTAVNALVHAAFKCEIDAGHPTFLRRTANKPYTEPHHLVPLAFSEDFDVSLDVEENIVSLCSNCHNQIHYGQGAEEMLAALLLERYDDLKKVGINITLKQLLRYYGLNAD